LKICVLGLWHLGIVTAACLASVGHDVVGLDFDPDNVARLNQGLPPLFEPQIEDLLQAGIKDGRLKFTGDIDAATRAIDVLWVTYDTPVDENDVADVEYVLEHVDRVLSQMAIPTLILISSQLPAGTVRRLESKWGGKGLSFAYSPENLRLGKAVSVFMKPDRVVVGIRRDLDRELIAGLFAAFTEDIQWMSVESAEMTKHALNAFLATSVTFINEIAVICEQVGADAKEVERGLKSEARIGPKAYLSPGGAFAGGTLARDISFLVNLGNQAGAPSHLLSAVRTSNNEHRLWLRRKIQSLLGSLKGKTVAVWGLTYKPGTDTLRRSTSVELCEWITENGGHVRAHDPAVTELPAGLREKIDLCSSAIDALKGADALVLATEWSDYTTVDPSAVLEVMPAGVVLDPGGFLAKQLAPEPRIRYFAVGKA
jgi:UDPglucose 6-dehydrogenase